MAYSIRAKTKDTGYYVKRAIRRIDAIGSSSSENVGSNDTFQRSLYQNSRLPNIEGVRLSTV